MAVSLALCFSWKENGNRGTAISSNYIICIDLKEFVSIILKAKLEIQTLLNHHNHHLLMFVSEDDDNEEKI